MWTNKTNFKPYTILMEHERDCYTKTILSIIDTHAINIHDALTIEQEVFNNISRKVNHITSPIYISTYKHIEENSRALPSKP